MAELPSILAELDPLLPAIDTATAGDAVPAVDFAKEMVVAVFAGSRSTGASMILLSALSAVVAV